jgi:hypothetical protein
MLRTRIRFHTLLGDVVGIVTFGAFVGKAAGAGNTIARKVGVFASAWSEVGPERFLIVEQDENLLFNRLAIFKSIKERGELLIDSHRIFGRKERRELGLERLGNLDDLLGSEHGFGRLIRGGHVHWYWEGF